MADGFGFGKVGQTDLAAALRAAETVGRALGLGEVDAPFAGAAAVEDEAFFLEQSAVAGIGDDALGAAGRGVGGTALIVHAHASTSFRAAAKAARQSSVFTSVAATMR